MHEPLIVTADEVLRESLVRLAAAAGVVPRVSAEPLEALQHWGQAPVVLVGVDRAAGVAELHPGRRVGVTVVSPGEVPHDTFRLAVALGAEQVVSMAESEEWLVEVLSDLDERNRPPATTIGVIGGAGGVGATTTACALAQVAGRGGDSVLIDTDPLGAGADHILGVGKDSGVHWEALHQTTGRIGARTLRDSLPKGGGVGVLTWRPGDTARVLAPFALRTALATTQRGHDTVVLDLGRGDNTAHGEVRARCDHLFVMVAPTAACMTSTARTLDRVHGHPRISVVVRGRDRDAAWVAEQLGTRVCGAIPDHRSVNESVLVGLGPVRNPRSGYSRALKFLLESTPEWSRVA